MSLLKWLIEKSVVLVLFQCINMNISGNIQGEKKPSTITAAKEELLWHQDKAVKWNEN